MFLATGAFAVWILLCNILFLSSRRPRSKNFSRFCPTEATKVSFGDEAKVESPDGEATVVVANPDIRDTVVDGENGRQEASKGDEEVDSSVLSAASVSRYEFSAGKGISGFDEEPKSMSFVVKEMFVNPSETSCKGKEMLVHEQQEHSAAEQEEEEEDEQRPDQYFDVESFMEMELIGDRDHQFEFVHNEEEGIEVHKEQLPPHGDDDSSLEGRQIESPEGFRREELVEKVLGEGDSLSDESQISPDCEEGESFMVKNSPPFTDQPNQSDDNEYIELKLREQGDLLLDKMFQKEEEEEEEEQGKLGFGVQKADCSTSESDWLWEHDDVVEQLKLELKNVRTGGLSTILEESESNYETPDAGGNGGGLKLLKTDGKMENKDRLGEIQKVYKSYAERMRKLDILNYQTLHAIGLIQLKDPHKSNGAAGICSASTVTSLLSHNSRKSRSRRRQIDPVMESVGACYKELEMVYVGHVCLSWEILQWQHGKVQELLESSCSRIPEQYNQVAGELQLFRVLLHRFLEEEPFRGSRVENYARTRCVLRSLLQVPAVKDDCFKDNKARVRDEDAISGAGLITLIEESMRVFWDFLHADKHEDNTVLGGFEPSRADGQQSEDSDIVMSLRTQLQKKERRLKEMSRSEGCIVKKFWKKDNRRLHHMMLLAQVELRLISRVLKVRRLTRDQVAWCREKMDRINFMGRMISVEKEPSFLLFPC